MPSAAGDPGGARPRRDDEQFAGQVRGMFDRIAGVYDLMNSAMTAGMHHSLARARGGPRRGRPGRPTPSTSAAAPAT